MSKLYIKINDFSCPIFFEQSLGLYVTDDTMRRHDILDTVLKKIKPQKYESTRQNLKKNYIQKLKRFI